MQQFALFSFYGNLNDFLYKKDKHTRITYSFTAIPAVKDAIEAIGVPHVEIEWLVINGISSPLTALLRPGDLVEVYPQDTPPAQKQFPPVRDKSKVPGSFVLDVHLGALARLLRLLGINTQYSTSGTDRELALISSTENRIMLTRDIDLLKHKIIEWGYWLRSQQPREQLWEVIKRYNLSSSLQPFTRCLSCNGTIQPVQKDVIRQLLPPRTLEYFEEFYQCLHCDKVYWKGSHYERMTAFITELKEKL
jgi:uncharacterized protein